MDSRLRGNDRLFMSCEMKDAIRISTPPLTEKVCRSLKTGDRVLLSGTIYTARDMAHRRLFESLRKNEALPLDLRDSIIFYAAPTPTKPGEIIGSVGPTTSSRMDPCTPALIKAGLKGMIGKGKRSPDVVAAMKQFGAVYLGAPGGVAALMAGYIHRAEVVAYGDLGPEAVMRLEVSEMPLIVLIDSEGRNLYEEVRREDINLPKPSNSY